MRRSVLLLLLAVPAMMGDTCGYDGTRRVGESCTRPDDCEAGLRCVAGRCIDADGGNGDAE